MDKDIAPGLINSVNDAFEKNCIKDPAMKSLARKLEKGEAGYEDAYKYAVSVGNARAKAFKSEVSSNVLPDGRMYYNIADRLMEDSLITDHNMVADYAEQVQKVINDNAGINLKAQRADADQDRIRGFVERLSDEENYDNVAWILDEPVKVHAMSVVDDTIKKNAEFQNKAGIRAAVSRDTVADCCPWCKDLAGDYIYPNVPKDVFARHDNCRCILEYQGKKLSAYGGGKGHSFRDSGEQEKLEARKIKYFETIEYNNRNGIIKSEKVSEKAKSHKMHNEKYGDNAILVNEKYIASEEYHNKFAGITNNTDVDDRICEHSRNILKDRSGTRKETLVLLDKSNGNPFLTIHANGDDGIVYTPEDEIVIADAKKSGTEILAIHNHPTGYPPTADDCVSALLKGYDTGITCGHNGTVHVYYPAEGVYTKEECDEIHSIIAEECEFKTSIDEVLDIWKNTLSEFGMSIKERR